jgi:hypothetical protein
MRLRRFLAMPLGERHPPEQVAFSVFSRANDLWFNLTKREADGGFGQRLEGLAKRMDKAPGPPLYSQHEIPSEYRSRRT